MRGDKSAELLKLLQDYGYSKVQFVARSDSSEQDVELDVDELFTKTGKPSGAFINAMIWLIEKTVEEYDTEILTVW